MTAQEVPAGVLISLENVLIDGLAIWGEGCRARTQICRRGHAEAAAWMEAHTDLIAAGWGEGFVAGQRHLTRESLRAKQQAQGPIIPDEPPEPGAVPAPVEIRSSLASVGQRFSLGRPHSSQATL